MPMALELLWPDGADHPRLHNSRARRRDRVL